MPVEIGARYLGMGKCGFRVYAPQAHSVSLELPGRQDGPFPLAAEKSGYWHALLEGIAPGDRYRFRVDENVPRPDPASFSQPDGVHEASQVWDHGAFPWSDIAWKGLPLEDYVIYELHAGTFTPEGTLPSATGKLGHLADLGVNAVELMPVCQFPGRRNWGYDGVYPFAVHNAYGGPDGLKKFVDACHAAGIAVILDVIYNHFGPEGNYLHGYGPYFTDRYRTPWGQALNFDGPGSDAVRRFFVANALYWFREYHVDALRLDAVDQIYDTSARPFLAELSGCVQRFSLESGRERYLIAESDLNDTRVLRGRETGGYGMHAQWLDDFHHSAEALINREQSVYRRDFGEPLQFLKAWREGFVYSGEYSPIRRKRFGNSSAGRPAREFVVFIQNHDQVGNRLAGDRISAREDIETCKLAAGAMLLSPYIPLLFMGQEYGETRPFLFFADFGDPGLVKAVREGRRREFDFPGDSEEIPDPMDEGTFLRSKLDWDLLSRERHGRHLQFYRALLALRARTPSLRRLDREGLEVSEHHGVFRLRRWSPGPDGSAGDETFSLLNFNRRSAQADLQAGEGRWSLILDSADARWDGPGSRAPAQAAAGESLVLPPMSFAVYRRLDPGR